MKRQNIKEAPTLPKVAVELIRPRTRGDCVDGPRPCPFISCRHNLLMDVSHTGSIQAYTHQDQASCALDEAEKGGMTLSEVGVILDITRERCRQIETAALYKLRQICKNPDKTE